MKLVYRAGGILMLIITFIVITHDTTIIKYLTEPQTTDEAKPEQGKPRTTIAEQDKFRKF
jgi:hypothetical protein